jgi:hypothetical protein
MNKDLRLLLRAIEKVVASDRRIRDRLDTRNESATTQTGGCQRADKMLAEADGPIPIVKHGCSNIAGGQGTENSSGKCQANMS